MIQALVIVIALAGQVQPNASISGKDLDDSERLVLQKYYLKTASEYSIDLGAKRDRKLSLHQQPILTYLNAVTAYMSYGQLFVWTLDNRPEAVGILWSRRYGNDRYAIHSFHSLSLDPLRAERNGAVFWSPKEAGIKPIEIPDAPTPAEKPQLRLAQMRSLAREFGFTTHQGTTSRTPRLIPQPVYRFVSDDGPEDGALFMWVDDWDPELLMFIEVRKTSSVPKWHVGFARLSNLTLSVQYKGKSLWEFTPNVAEPPLGGPNLPYYSVHNVERIPMHEDTPN